ncbi:MAG TPA: phosphatase PAP2 family protein [Gemmatimonadales bacterium]
MRHKTRLRWAILLPLASLPLPRPLNAQVPSPNPTAVRAGDVVAVGTGTVLALLPRVLGVGSGTVACAPCDPRTLPGFDRWVVRETNAVWGRASDFLLLGLLLFGGVSTATQDAGGPYVTGMVEAGVWTAAVTEWVKAGVARHRPVMYTEDAPAAAADVNNVRSFPSGHASLAFGVATSYWLARRDLTGSPGAAAWAVAGAAAGVGAFRMLAGKHFLSDVLAGALLGVAGGAAVHAIKF